MYEVFGPMDTEELNACAKGLREEGDDDRIRVYFVRILYPATP